jgi:hypothetical protein
MLSESESAEQGQIDLVCDKIISHLEELKAEVLRNQEERTKVDATIPTLGGNAAWHYESEAKLIEETIIGVRQKDPKYLSRFIDHPMQGLDLTPDELNLINEFVASSGTRAA